MNGVMWGIINILAPAILLAVLVWAYLRNRAAGRRNFEQAERGARELREQLEKEDAAR